jgi:hypothetical protein
MSTSVGPLYHWSPRERFEVIRLEGLRIGMPTPREEIEDGFRAPYICFSTTPATAWSYALTEEGKTYDLWQVYILDTDEVHLLPMWGDNLIEVRLRNNVTPGRLIYIGERTH